MKKTLLRLLLPVIVTLIPVFAQAATYRVDLDDASRVTLFVGDTEYTSAVNGLNSIDMGSERYLRVTTNQGILFTEITFVDEYYNEETSWLDRVFTFENGCQYIDLYSSFPEDELFRIRTSGATEARSASFTLTVDDPTAFVLTRKELPVELTTGANVIKFDPATESTFEITPVSKPLYSVTLNGEPVKGDYRYVFTVADGDAVDVQAKFPDIDCKVSIMVSGGGAEHFISSMDIDGKPAFNWKEDFTVKAGTEVTLRGNTTEYEVLGFTINGVSAMFTNPTTIFVDGDAQIEIWVRKYATFEMVINVDDPSRLHVYRGYSYNGDEITLSEGDNIVEITRNIPIVSIIPADGCYVNTMSIGGYNYEPYELQVAPIMVGSLTDDEVLSITTAPIVRDLNAVVYVQNLEAAADYFKFKRADLSQVEMTEGYNMLPFYERDNAFRIETGGPVPAAVLVNDEFIEPQPGGFTYAPSIADGDVIKVYFDFVPQVYDIEIEDDGVANDYVYITKDIVTSVQGKTLKASSNTLLTFTFEHSSCNLAILVDDECFATLKPYQSTTFNVTDNHKIKLFIIGGIDDLETDSAASVEYYNLQGVRQIARPATGAYITVTNGLATKHVVK